MARKAGGRRSYVRDGLGRFASTPGGGSGKKPAKGRSASTGRPQPRTFRQRQQASLDRRPGQGGYLGKATREAKAKLRASKAKLKTNATPQQRAAVTRARIRAEGASPVTRMRRTAAAGVMKGVKATRAQGRRVKPGKAQAPQPPQKQQGNPLARMATIGRKRVRLTGRLINMNARSPVQFEPPKKQSNPYYPFSVKDSRNIDQAKKILESMGVKVSPLDWSGDTAVARGGLGRNEIFLNPNAQYWENPGKRSREMRRSGYSSSSSPLHLLFHEIGHNRHKGGSALWYLSGSAKNWNKGIVPHSEWAKSISPAKVRELEKSPLGKIKLGKRLEAIARRVSGYAATNPVEFVAETYAGLRTGRKYDREVMAAYREAMGLSAKPPARMRSRLPRRRKPKP